jgi:molecular chaperone DnaK
MVFQCEKILVDEADKFEASDKEELEKLIDNLKEALKGEDMNLIKSRQEELQKKFYDVSEKLYKANAPQGDPQAAGFDPSQFTGGAAPDGGAEDVKFTDVD